MMMLMLAIAAWAGEVTDVLTGAATGVTGSSYTEWSGVTLNSEAVYAGQSAGTYGSIQLRSKNNNSGVITTASGGTVKSVTVEFNSNTMDGRTLNVYGKNSAYSAATDLYDSSLQGELLGSFVKGGETSSLTVSGDYEYIAFRSAADAMYIESITIVWEIEGETPVTVDTPVITGETPFDENTEVTITCATEGASIYYTLDGADPTSASTPYAGAFELTETTTVKAIAYDATGAASSVATKEFVKEEPSQVVTCATVAEIKALDDDTEFTFTGQLVVSGHAHAASGTNNWLFAQDETGGIQLYRAIQDYQKDDVIPAGFTAIKKTYGGAAQLQDIANMQAATETQELVAEELTPAQINLDKVFKYAVIRGATIANNNITVGGESVVIYNNRFNVEIPNDNNTYDVYGITSYFNGTNQFMPLDFVAYELEVPATPVITGETPFVGSTTVTITCETEGVSIYYTIDGTEPSNQSTAYTAPFELTESATVKAYAYDATGAVSALATKEFVKKISCATVSEILALENNTTFAFTGELVVIGQAGQRLYAQDEAGDGIFFYGTAPSYEMYDVIPAGWSAKRTTYKGAPELANMTDMAEATETAELTAAEMTPAEVTVDPYNLFFYAVIKGATIEDGNIVVGDNSVAIYDRFGVATPDDAEGKIYDIYGVPSWYEGAQFFPIEFVEVVEKTESPEIAYVEGDTEYLIFVNGVGELKLYVEDMEVEIPYVVVRTNEDQTITFVATAQEEGKEISDPTVLTIIVPKLEISEIEQLFVVGTFNNWSQETGMIELIENENNEFVGDVELEAGAEFKLFTPYGDGLKWFGGVDENNVGYFLINSDMLETPITLIEGANFRVEEAGNYNITVVEAESKGVQEPLVMTIKKNTPEAIEAINMENVKAVRYYNVAGVESATPFQGVNIVVREMTDGTKNVTKMMK